MPGHQKTEHVELRVNDVDASVTFCTDVMGLSVIDTRDGVTYLGCGLDENYDIAFRGGEPGMEHVAIRVNADRLRSIESRLAERDITSERRDETEPGQELGLRVEDPSGLTVELVTVTDMRILNDYNSVYPREGVTPLDLDHATFGVTDLQATTAFFVDVLGFKETTIKTSTGTRGGEWESTFVRDGVSYHDLAFFQRAETAISHVAWEMSNINHMKSFIDKYADAGYNLETSIHRHDVANNLAAYFLEPGGPHMYEICCEEATVDPDSPPIVTTSEDTQYSAWGGVTPAKRQQ